MFSFYSWSTEYWLYFWWHKVSLRIRTFLYHFFFFFFSGESTGGKKKNVFIAWAYLRKSPKTLKCSMFTSQLYLCSDTVRKKGTGKVVFPASDLSCNRPPANIFGYFLFLKSTNQYCYKILPRYPYRTKPSAAEPGGPAVLVKVVL